ncbi:hypothetical protein AAVH_09878 [Aphelenchoides avenae]|nr:hypothetical protein AAVH_09878 [Aphelenchus avenae]
MDAVPQTSRGWQSAGGYNSPSSAHGSDGDKALGAQAYDQVLFYVAPVALAITVCLCCIRMLLLYCMHWREQRHQSTTDGVQTVSGRQRRELRRLYRNNRFLEMIYPYAQGPYGEIFTQTPPPKYDDAMKTPLSRDQTASVVIDIPDESQGPPPYVEDSSSNPSESPSVSRHVLPMHISHPDLSIAYDDRASVGSGEVLLVPEQLPSTSQTATTSPSRSTDKQTRDAP